MGLAALVIAIIAAVFGILPLVYTQLVGIVFGVIAVVLGVWGRKLAGDQGRRKGMATAGAALGLVAVLLSGALYGAFLYSAGRVGEEMVRKIGGEIHRGQDRSGMEFRRAVERAIQRARVHTTAPVSPAAQKPRAARRESNERGKPARKRR